MAEVNFLDRLESAWTKAVKIKTQAEALVFLTIINCLESFEDVEVELLEIDDKNIFINKWVNELLNKEANENFQSALTFETTPRGNKVLRCSFDLYKIKETLIILNDEEFGIVNTKKIEETLLSSEDSIISGTAFENAGLYTIQKVKTPKETIPKENN